MESNGNAKIEEHYSTVKENGITIKESNDKKSVGKYNPKLFDFRQFALATVHAFAEDHATRQSGSISSDHGKRQFFACDLIAQSGMAGLQWKKQLGDKVHVTLVQQREAQSLLHNVQGNGFMVSPLPVDSGRPAGTLLPQQTSLELHLALCDPVVLMNLESFDFVYVDPHKNPSPYFSSIFRNVHNSGIVCFVVPDTMHFARSPHVVQRCYGAHCMKTEYLKELAVRIILATLAMEAAKCNKALNVLYAVSLEDFLLLAVQVARGPKLADDMLQQKIGHVLHCRICEERAFYPAAVAPVENPYSLISCDCHKNVPGKTGVILGPLWKGSLYDYSCLTRLASSGKRLSLSPSFFKLLQRVMEDCLCDIPPSLQTLQKGLVHHRSDELPRSGNGDIPETCPSDAQNGAANPQKHPQNDDGRGGRRERDSEIRDDGDSAVTVGSGRRVKSSSGADPALQDPGPQSLSEAPVQDTPAAVTDACESRGVKRPAPGGEELNLPEKRLKGVGEPAPCFFYNMHSKRLGSANLPKHHAIIERLRAHGYRCCRTHFERYAIRTDADLKTLTSLLGASENKVLYVKGSHPHV